MDDGVTLRQHIEALLNAQAERVALALAAADRAVAKAEAAADARFAAVNEFRATLADQQARLMTRSEFEANVAGLRADIVDLKERLTRAEGKGAGAVQLWMILLGIVALIGGVLGITARFGGP